MLSAIKDGSPFVTMGSPYREIDYERVWTNRLQQLTGKKTRKNAGRAGQVGSFAHTNCHTVHLWSPPAVIMWHQVHHVHTPWTTGSSPPQAPPYAYRHCDSIATVVQVAEAMLVNCPWKGCCSQHLIKHGYYAAVYVPQPGVSSQLLHPNA